MKHLYISLAVALGFVVIVQTFASPDPIFRYLVPAVVVFVLVLSFYHIRLLKSLHMPVFWTVVRVALFITAWFGVFALLPGAVSRGWFLLLTVPLLFAVEYTVATVGEYVLVNQTILSAFALHMVLWGMQYYFRAGSWWFYFLVPAASFILARASFDLVPQEARVRTMFAGVLALFVFQFSWAISLLPFHYSAQGLLSFSLFYLLWILCYYYLFNTLTLKRIQFHIAFALLTILLIFLITPWKAIV